jgi:hypothetical protein
MQNRAALGLVESAQEARSRRIGFRGGLLAFIPRSWRGNGKAWPFIRDSRCLRRYDKQTLLPRQTPPLLRFKNSNPAKLAIESGLQGDPPASHPIDGLGQEQPTGGCNLLGGSLIENVKFTSQPVEDHRMGLSDLFRVLPRLTHLRENIGKGHAADKWMRGFRSSPPFPVREAPHPVEDPQGEGLSADWTISLMGVGFRWMETDLAFAVTIQVILPLLRIILEGAQKPVRFPAFNGRSNSLEG